MFCELRTAANLPKPGIFLPLNGTKIPVEQSKYTGWWFQKFFVSPLPGEMMIQLDEHMFQMGWFSHQLASTGRGINPRYMIRSMQGSEDCRWTDMINHAVLLGFRLFLFLLRVSSSWLLLLSLLCKFHRECHCFMLLLPRFFPHDMLLGKDPRFHFKCPAGAPRIYVYDTETGCGGGAGTMLLNTRNLLCLCKMKVV